MLPRRSRLSRERLTELMKTGSRAHGRLFTYVYSKNSAPGISVVVSKKVAKTSVLRHKIRRRAYDAVRRSNPSFSIALIAKATVVTAKPVDIVADLERTLLHRV